jgi:hypothetical protein
LFVYCFGVGTAGIQVVPSSGTVGGTQAVNCLPPPITKISGTTPTTISFFPGTNEFEVEDPLFGNGCRANLPGITCHTTDSAKSITVTCKGPVGKAVITVDVSDPVVTTFTWPIDCV